MILYASERGPHFAIQQLILNEFISVICIPVDDMNFVVGGYELLSMLECEFLRKKISTFYHG